MTTDKTVDPTEVDTCRICSGPAEEDQPLFYPCKCSGTIRYIHQDCLTTWLAHSKKRSCDVCKYEYGFTKVYKNDMPRRLPPRLFLRKLSLQMVKVVITSLRLVMISVIWLAILPYLTLWVWRFYFWTGEALAYWVVGKEIPNRTYSPPKPTSEPLTEDTPSTPPPPQSPWFNVNILPQELGADIFKGQIITIAVVIVFLTIFLLREWIIQNARPGVFGDEEPAEPLAAVPDAPPVEVAQDPAAGAALVAAQLLNALEPVAAFEEPQVELLPEAEDDVEVVEPELREDFLDEHEHDALTDDPIDEDGEDSASAHSEDDVVSIPSNSEGEHGQAEAPTLQAQSLDTPTEQTLVPQEAENASFDDTSAIPSSSKLDQSSSTVFGASTKLGNDLSLPSSFAFSSPATTSGSLGASIESSLDGSRPADSQMYSSLSSDATQSQFQASVADFSFTFSAPHRTSVQEEALNVPLPDSPIENRPTIFGALGSDSTPMPSGPMAIQAPRPHQIRSSRAGPSKRMTSSTPAFNKNAKDFDEFRFSFSSTPTTLSQGSSRHSSRPPLPPSTPGVDEPTPLVDSGMASPHVALYRPPEDLSSAAPDYFDRFPIASSSKTALPHSSSTETEKPAGDDGENLQNPESSSDEEEPYIPQPPRQRQIDDRVFMREFEQRGEVRRRGLAQAPPIAPLPAPPPPPLDDDEDDVDEDPQDIEPMGDDDMDGALEAIGMRGPITSVFQNVFLMIFIIDLAIAVGIWMPFTMGKTTALLFLQPADVLALVRFPIITVRVMTDPIVDTLLLLLNFLIRPIKWGIGHILPSAVLVSKQAAAAPPAPKAGLSLAVIQNAVFRHWDRLLEHSHAAANASAPRPSPTNAIERLVFRLPAPSVQSLEHVESRFAAFGRAVRLFSHAFARRWQQLALADGTSERAFAICLGYAVLCMVMGIYLGVLNAGAVRGAARALRNAVKQQLIVVKVALFIGLELLVFPTGCGVVLDIATLPLFESATLAGRVAFYDFAPLTAFFCHWLVGTIFMYQFALTLGACRAVMRPGAMWFIKDPQDASFSPIRDILDKRVLTQLRKLAVSAVMYTVVIVVAVGSVVYTIRYAAMFSGILPLRGNMREPLSEIPVDLLFLHLVMPPTVKRLTIGSWVKVRLEVWWKYTARQLRLSSFMFNKLYADELQRESRGLRPIEGPTEGWTIPQDDQLYGRWLRVPKSDNIAFLRDQPVLIEVNQAGQAVRQRGREVMAEQDEETRRAGRQPEQDYIIVHVPPYFGMRCMALIILLWLTAAAVTVVGTAGPVVLGRWMLKIFAHKTNVHDGYSLVLGWYVLWGAWRVHQSEVRSWTTAVAWLANVIWIGLGMGVVMPILVAITLQLYVVLPLRLAWDPTMVPVIRVVEEWALGLVLMKIGWQTWRLRNRGRAGAGADAAAAPVPADGAAPEADEVDEADRRVEDLGRAMEQIVRAGLANPDAITATQSFIAPVCGGLLLVIGGPALAVWALGRGGEDVLLTVVYPGIFSLTAAVGVWRAGTKVGKKWLQDVRDAEFLVEMRLKNLEPLWKEAPFVLGAGEFSAASADSTGFLGWRLIKGPFALAGPVTPRYLAMSGLPSDIPYRSERVSPGGTRHVVYTIPDPPKPKVHLDEEAPSDYLPGGYLRVRIGERFAHRYRIVRKLGWGHFSTVWLAHDNQADTHVALKFVKSAPRYSQTAADEIALLQHVIDSEDQSHPGRDRLVTFLDSFTHTNPRTSQVHRCIAFEPLGMNLLQLLQQPEHKHRGIPLPLVKQIARQTLHGLDYLHRVCKLIHTDLKPENILLRIAPGSSHIENHIRAELASTPPATEHSVPIGGRTHHGRYAKHNAVYIINSQPLSPSPPCASSKSWKTSPSTSFEQLALRMSKLVVDEDDTTASVDSSCAASAIFSLTSTSASASGSGWTSEAEPDDADTPNARMSVVEGPSLLSKTAPAKLELPRAEDQLSIKIADLGNAVRIGRRATDDIQTRQYRSPEVILRKSWGPEVDLFSLGCVVFELLTGDFLFEPKGREPLWSRDDDHICQMHEALGPFTPEAAMGGVFSKSIFRSDCTLRNVPARKINMWPLESVLRDKYELDSTMADAANAFLRPILALNPAERASALEAVEHPWLWS